MDAKEQILASLPRVPPEAPPRYAGPTQRFDDAVTAFGLALEAAGGTLVIGSEAPPETALRGRFGVVESGAVWWVPRDENERREAFLSERMELSLHSENLVHTLHEAYSRIVEAPPTPFACFVSGPSKTADIEQALVIGAHGPKELIVWLTVD